MATASEDMQIMCFGDVYVAAEVPTKPKQSIDQMRPALEERNDSGYVDPLPTISATPASVHDQPVRAAESPMPSPPTSPCRSSFHRRQSSDSSKRELLRSLFSPSTLKGRLAQVLVSVVLTSTALSSYLWLVFTNRITQALQIFLLLTILFLGIYVLHSLVSLWIFRLQHPPLLPIAQVRCENPKTCNLCHSDDTLPRDDSLYAPKGAIRVHLSRDEELKLKQLQHALDYSDTTTSHITIPSPPPAYGAWRCSVRADPSLLHWHKVDVDAGDSAAMAEPELDEDTLSCPTVNQNYDEQAVRVSIGRARPAIVDIRTSGSYRGVARAD